MTANMKAFLRAILLYSTLLQSWAIIQIVFLCFLCAPTDDLLVSLINNNNNKNINLKPFISVNYHARLSFKLVNYVKNIG